MLARQLLLRELDATIARAEERLARHRLEHKLRFFAGLDTTGCEALVRRARTRLDNLHQQRFILLLGDRARHEGED
jgi:hypothetical protein